MMEGEKEKKDEKRLPGKAAFSMRGV